jgi:hypothetical protein
MLTDKDVRSLLLQYQSLLHFNRRNSFRISNDCLYGLSRFSSLTIVGGLWALWAEGRAVDNRFIVIHGKRPVLPAGCAGKLSTSP